jgi:hypothetical protein
MENNAWKNLASCPPVFLQDAIRIRALRPLGNGVYAPIIEIYGQFEGGGWAVYEQCPEDERETMDLEDEVVEAAPTTKKVKFGKDGLIDWAAFHDDGLSDSETVVGTERSASPTATLLDYAPFNVRPKGSAKSDRGRIKKVRFASQDETFCYDIATKIQASGPTTQHVAN